LLNRQRLEIEIPFNASPANGATRLHRRRSFARPQVANAVIHTCAPAITPCKGDASPRSFAVNWHFALRPEDAIQNMHIIDALVPPPEQSVEVLVGVVDSCRHVEGQLAQSASTTP
jgi:hypothetical protein